ncbi:hypothetical protein DPEC_G00304550 [Dallia pectoralis]|uniref:Uncharacterized protein n=1 Tax=Dallia pectoralis TaxID=75939 RepID=A0ACC2FDI2_DALPE|nr:hypothetical protein DPEC_G00304550 [Dallia pectoralis]
MFTLPAGSKSHGSYRLPLRTGGAEGVWLPRRGAREETSKPLPSVNQLDGVGGVVAKLTTVGKLGLMPDRLWTAPESRRC